MGHRDTIPRTATRRGIACRTARLSHPRARAAWQLTFLVFSLVASPAFLAFSCEQFDDGTTLAELVELDDGDSRLVEVEKIRMLPPDYSRVGRKNILIEKFLSIH